MSDPTGRSTPAFQRLCAHLAELDLDPPTLEILIAVLNADLDLRDVDPDRDDAVTPAGA